MVSSTKLLEDALRTEKNVDVRERLLLVRRVLVDNEQTARIAEKELHRSRWQKWIRKLLIAVDERSEKAMSFGITKGNVHETVIEQQQGETLYFAAVKLKARSQVHG